MGICYSTILSVAGCYSHAYALLICSKTSALAVTLFRSKDLVRVVEAIPPEGDKANWAVRFLKLAVEFDQAGYLCIGKGKVAKPSADSGDNITLQNRTESKQSQR